MKSDSPKMMMSNRRQLLKVFSPAVMASLLFTLGAVTFLVLQEAVPLDRSEKVRVQRRSVDRDCRMLQNTAKEKDEGIGPGVIDCGWRARVRLHGYQSGMHTSCFYMPLTCCTPCKLWSFGSFKPSCLYLTHIHTLTLIYT